MLLQGIERGLVPRFPEEEHRVVAKRRPDAVFLALSMPAGGGLSVAARLRDLVDLAATPIIFMSASKKPRP